MSYLTYKDVSLVCPWDILHIISFQANIQPNKHASICVRAMVSETTIKQLETDALDDATIELLNNGKILFVAEITKAQSMYENGVCYIEIEGLSGTSNLDIKKKSRSFQNNNMTYSKMVDQILEDSAGTCAIYTSGDGTKIGAPLIQFRETDWTYIKRMASHFQSVLIPEVTSVKPRFWFGMPEGRKQKIESITEYKVGQEDTLEKTPFFYYEIKTDKNMDIGDRVNFKDKPMLIYKKSICLENHLFVFRYGLCDEGHYQTIKKYNHSIVGMTILGKVLATNKEQMKLHLNIDKQQQIEEAYWYDYVPTTGNMMYCMPKVGTKVALYFPDEDENHAKVHYCVRTNGAASGTVSKALSNPECRYFYTEHQKAWALLPTNLYFESIQGPAATKKLKLELIDGQSTDALDLGAGSDDFLGIRGLSSKKVFIMAMEELAISSQKYIDIVAPSCLANFQWGAMKQTSTAHILSSAHHFLANKVYLDTVSGGEIYPDFDDAPKKGEYNWWSIGLKALLGVGLIVAGVAVICTSVIDGPAGLIAGGALIGAGISSCSVAYSEYQTGNAVGLGEYLTRVGVGFVTGAIACVPGFSPAVSILVFGTASTWTGMKLEEVLLDVDYDWDDYKIQALVAGAFNTLSFGFTKLFRGKIRTSQQNKVNAQKIQIDDQISQIDQQITSKYGGLNGISGNRVKEQFLEKLSNDEFIALCEQLDIPYNQQHPRWAINDLKRAIVNNKHIIMQPEITALNTQKDKLDILLRNQFNTIKNFDIKEAIHQNNGDTMMGIKAYNNALKGNPYLPADGLGNMSGNVLNAAANNVFDFNSFIDEKQSSINPCFHNQAIKSLEEHSLDNPNTNFSQGNDIGMTIWEKVYDMQANVEPNYDTINKVETIKQTFGLKSEFGY